MLPLCQFLFPIANANIFRGSMQVGSFLFLKLCFECQGREGMGDIKIGVIEVSIKIGRKWARQKGGRGGSNDFGMTREQLYGSCQISGSGKAVIMLLRIRLRSPFFQVYLLKNGSCTFARRPKIQIHHTKGEGGGCGRVSTSSLLNVRQPRTYNLIFIFRMIPTIQMVPNPIIPFVSLFDINSGQYLGQISPYTYPYFQATNMINLPLNFYSTTPSQSPLVLVSDTKSTETSFAKSAILSSEFKNRSENSNQQDEGQASRNRSCGDQNESLPTPLRKKIQFKDRILKITQNRNRNIIPSVVQQIFSYLSKPNKSKAIASRVFAMLEQPQPQSFSVKRYFYFIKQIKQKLNHYLNVNSLCVLSTVQTHCLQLIPQQEQMFYLEMARRVAKHFVQNQLPLLIIHSKKMFEDKRVEHFKVRRMLVEVLQNLEC